MVDRIGRQITAYIKTYYALARWLFYILLSTSCFFIFITLTGCQEHFVGMLNPKGIIAHQERKLFFDTLALMLIVVLPVIIMSFTFIYHYQVSHHTRDYKPNWGHSFFLEAIWWGIPCAIILVLAIVTWKKTHQLDPYAKIPNQLEAPLLVQVIALPWKWLFIYPEYNIATINYLVMPVNRQIEYWITADNVPMSAFFIPQLGSQIYAMAGMRTRLHLIANQTGVYEGLNTQYNGNGFSDMHFTVQVIDEQQWQTWISATKKSPLLLTTEVYAQLLNPSMNDKPQFFKAVSANLFEDAIMLYMNTFGTQHPRENQFKFQYPLSMHGE